MGEKTINKKSLVLFFLTATLLLTMLFRFDNSTFLKLVFASDSYGNNINFVAVYQWNGTVYILRHNITSTGGTYRIYNNQTTKFIVNIKFNSTLASSTAEAISFTKIYMNITTGIWNNEELNNTDCTLIGNYYILNENGVWNTAGYPIGGTTYACAVLYEGYY